MAFSPNGRPERDHGLPDLQGARLAERGRGEVVDVLGLDDRDVGQRVGPDDLGLLGGAVVEVDRDGGVAAHAGDDVVVGEDLAVLGQDDARAGASSGLAGHVDLDHGGQHGGRHLLDGAVLDQGGRGRLVLAGGVRGGDHGVVVVDGVERRRAADACGTTERPGRRRARPRRARGNAAAAWPSAWSGPAGSARTRRTSSAAQAAVPTDMSAAAGARGCTGEGAASWCPQGEWADRTRGACRPSGARRRARCRGGRSGCSGSARPYVPVSGIILRAGFERATTVPRPREGPSCRAPGTRMRLRPRGRRRRAPCRRDGPRPP